MSAEKDREPISAMHSQAPVPAGAVFLSYASEDGVAAERIATALRSAGIEVWLDKSELRGGDAWDRQIREQIQRCRLFMPIVSANTEARLEGYFRREWKLAVDRTHDLSERVAFLVPLVIDSTTEQKADVPEAFRHVQWTRLPGGETPSAFVERVRRLLSPPDPSAAHPPHPAPARASVAPMSGVWRYTRLGNVVLAVAALAIIAVGYLAIDRWVLSRRPVSPVSSQSIAVLPLVNESGDANQQYFSDGLSEDLITALSKVPGLKVIGRNSAFQFRDTKEDSKSIGARLGVAYLLAGSVRHAEDIVRVSTELISTTDGSTQWSERYDRPYKDLFALQDDITRSVAGALKVHLLSGENAPLQRDRPPSGNLEAYNAVLEGRYYLARHSESDVRKAIERFTLATQLDPRYALAWSLVSGAWTILGASFLDLGEAEQQAYAKARAAANTALSLAPDLASAHVARGGVLLLGDLNWRGAEAEFRRALELAPEDGDAKDGLGGVLAAFGRVEKAIQLVQEALRSDPLRADYYKTLAYYFLTLNRLDEADQSVRRAIELQPGAQETHLILTMIEVRRGNARAALTAAQQEVPSLDQAAALALALQIGSDHAAADAALENLINYPVAYPFAVARVYAIRNDANKAFEWLDRSITNHEAAVGNLLIDPFVLRFKDDPRFAEFCRKVGLPTPAEVESRT
jgi:TolB-like protein/Tfp pilus assembly protein PilF